MGNFEDNVRKWVKIDDEIRKANEHARQLREQRNTIANGIYTYVNNNQLGNATVNISDGRLRFVETTTAQSLTFKFLEDCLSEVIQNNDSVKHIMTHIKNKRQSKSSPEIKRYFSE